MNVSLFLFLFLFLFIKSNSLHLNNYQIRLLNNLIQNEKLTLFEREKIHLILYKAYEKFAVKKALEFKVFHRYKCADMKVEEIIFSSKIGLFKAIKNYNGKYNFINYSSIYIKSELLKLLTDKYSLSSLPKKYRRTNKKDKKEMNKNMLDVTLTIHYEPWQLDSIFVSDEDIISKVNKKYDVDDFIYNTQSVFIKRILYLKYYFYCSNKQISELMRCSEETIRVKLNGLK